MARKYQLKERTSNEDIYPVTLTNCVIDDSGTALTDILDSKAEKYELSNIISEDVVDSEVLPELGQLTREELKKDLFIDLWNQACILYYGSFYNDSISTEKYGQYNPETDKFELYDMEFDYEEALRIYSKSYLPYIADNMSRRFACYPERAILPLKYQQDCGGGISYNCAFYRSRHLEVVGGLINPNESHRAFQDCTKLRKVEGKVSFYQAGPGQGHMFDNCPLLQDVNIYRLSSNFSIPDSPLLSFSSVKYLVDYKSSTTSITVTLHPNIYSALTGEASEYPFNGGTQEEWEQLLLDAQAKNITFST